MGAWGVLRGTRDLDAVVDQEERNLAALASLAEALDGKVRRREAFVSTAFAMRGLLASGERVQIELAWAPSTSFKDCQTSPSSGSWRRGPFRLSCSASLSPCARRMICAR